MPQVVEDIRRTAEARLRELKPLLAEARQLEELLATLDGSDAESEPESRAVAPRRPRGSNKRLIVDVVSDHPGMAAPEIAALTGLKRTVVASTISRLKRSGELEPHGSGVRLPSAQLARSAA